MATFELPRTQAALRNVALDIAVVDDSPLLMDGIEYAVADVDGMDVVLRSTYSDNLPDEILAAAPDVLLLEPWTQAADGPALIADLHQRDPAMTIIAVSSVTRPDHVQHVLERGASAYLGKDVASRDLPSLVRQVRNGATIHPPLPGVSKGVLNGNGNHAGTDVTARELQVLQLVAQGLSNQQVGDQLFVTEQTVKFHLRNINRKLGARNRTEAVHLAKRTGLIG